MLNGAVPCVIVPPETHVRVITAIEKPILSVEWLRRGGRGGVPP
jgi:hypothetical protein